jgi:hypothetical protein
MRKEGIVVPELSWSKRWASETYKGGDVGRREQERWGGQLRDTVCKITSS